MTEQEPRGLSDRILKATRFLKGDRAWAERATEQILASDAVREASGWPWPDFVKVLYPEMLRTWNDAMDARHWASFSARAYEERFLQDTAFLLGWPDASDFRRQLALAPAVGEAWRKTSEAFREALRQEPGPCSEWLQENPKGVDSVSRALFYQGLQAALAPLMSDETWDRLNWREMRWIYPAMLGKLGDRARAQEAAARALENFSWAFSAGKIRFNPRGALGYEVRTVQTDMIRAICKTKKERPFEEERDQPDDLQLLASSEETRTFEQVQSFVTWLTVTVQGSGWDPDRACKVLALLTHDSLEKGLEALGLKRNRLANWLTRAFDSVLAHTIQEVQRADGRNRAELEQFEKMLRRACPGWNGKKPHALNLMLEAIYDFPRELRLSLVQETSKRIPEVLDLMLESLGESDAP